jgi:glycine/D-amino acid oxidase-like deaminating enzyme
VVLEAEIAGFGASGRNGGWLIGEVLGEDRLLAGLNPKQRAHSRRLLHDIPDEVGRVIAREGIDCHYRKGGVLYCAARYPTGSPPAPATGRLARTRPWRGRLPLAGSWPR